MAPSSAFAPQVSAPGGQGSNSAVVRQYNERVILATLRRLGEASKADLARHAKLTQNTTGLIVRDLIASGLVREMGRREGARGQPATLLSLDPHGVCSIGLKLGRRSLCAVLVDFGGEVLHVLDHERALPGPDEALAETAAALVEMRAAVPKRARGRLAGVGLAMPYDLDSWRRELCLPGDALKEWHGFDFVGALRHSLDLPLFVENDGTAVAVAELFQGHGRDLNDFVSVYIACALGGGVVLRGEYRRGMVGNAGDIGLMPTSPSRLASAAHPETVFDILLNRASISSLMRHLRANDVAVVTRGDLASATKEHPHLVDDWLDDCADALVNPLQSIGAMLDLEGIVVDGDLDRDLIERLVTRLRELLDAASPEARRPPRLMAGSIGRNAAAIGAAILPLHLNFSPDQRLLFGSAA